MINLINLFIVSGFLCLFLLFEFFSDDLAPKGSRSIFSLRVHDSMVRRDGVIKSRHVTAMYLSELALHKSSFLLVAGL